MYQAHSYTTSHVIFLITCRDRAYLSPFCRWVNEAQENSANCPKSASWSGEHGVDPQTNSKACAFLTTSAPSKRTSAVVMRAGLKLSMCFGGPWKHAQGRTFGEMNALKTCHFSSYTAPCTQGLKFVWNVLVSVHPHFVCPDPLPHSNNQRHKPSLDPSLSCYSTSMGKRRRGAGIKNSA